MSNVSGVTFSTKFEHMSKSQLHPTLTHDHRHNNEDHFGTWSLIVYELNTLINQYCYHSNRN